MQFPDEIYLSKISTRGLYFDKNSKEVSTGIVKGKFKLAGINGDILSGILQIYRFFVGTSEVSSCQKELTLEVKNEHWEDVIDGHIFSVSTFFDVRNIDVITRDGLLEKLKDQSNGFPYVGKLKYDHFGELQKIAFSLHRAHKPIRKVKANDIVNALIRKTDVANEIMKKLGL